MSWYKIDTVRKAAEGRWLSILAALAPALEAALRQPGHHVSCPVHGGKDGFALLMWLNGWDFGQCLNAVGDYLGVAKEEPGYRQEKPAPRRPYTPPPWLRGGAAEMERKAARERAYRAHLRGRIAKLWNACVPFSDAAAEPMRLYFGKRRLPSLIRADNLRFAAAMP